jgi:glycosyltransferase involved in cell wall biosynthesis
MCDCSPSANLPLVSAVIPTRDRPELLALAIRSAFRQTWPQMEIIVVVDGPDERTESYLNSITDPRLRTVFLPWPCGGSAARNAGVRSARGEWIAFLDDDDEWLPRKIERQMQAVRQGSAWFPIISCRLIAQSPSASRVLPSRLYQAPQPVADYLFCRNSLSDSGGLMQTSTLLASRQLLLAIPFREGLPMHQDWDWLIRAAARQGVSISMLPEPLSIWRVEDARATVGRGSAWQPSLGWIREVRFLISPRAFSWFLAVQCAWRARASRAGLLARARLLWAFLFLGQPEWRSFVHSLIFNFVPTPLRRMCRDRFWRNSDGTGSGLRIVFSRDASPAALRKKSV